MECLSPSARYAEDVGLGELCVQICIRDIMCEYVSVFEALIDRRAAAVWRLTACHTVTVSVADFVRTYAEFFYSAVYYDM